MELRKNPPLGEFPDISQVTPKDEAIATVWVSVGTLETIVKAAKKAGCKGLQVEILSDMKPLRITSYEDNNISMRAVVMPRNLPK